ncbi:hypothetical protein NEOLEDRAFT_1245638 [Neolentinus lepideus HHB14362 ss-1]|uniref:Uncharacterized protein n=1 Tax=Neolentinus lepideus HHB14362 ss-1 TaxID=1314782 RepID=A0A165NLH2_9AGAM|nr:hypothetical protein NEOLEDRAFT_1245638 [Neolentinus lepideus HHB14362 ss-1]
MLDDTAKERLTEAAIKSSPSSHLLPENATSSSSIRRLPPELLSQIFIHCLLPDTFLSPKWQVAPLLPSQVCHIWRITALSTPLLWASLDIKPSKLMNTSWLDLTRGFLARAGALPLSVRFSVPIESEIEDFIKPLMPYISRSRELSLKVPPAAIWFLTRETYPFLRSLCVNITQCSLGSESEQEQPMVLAPHLSTVSFLGWFTPWLLYKNVLPWSRLRKCSLSQAAGTYKWLKVLRHCSELTSLEIEFNSHLDQRSLDSSAADVILLSRLRELAIVARNGVGVGAFLDYLSAPALVDLRAHVRTTSVPLVRTITGLLARSGCKLENMEIDGAAGFFGCMCIAQNIKALLAQVPHLRIMNISDCRDYRYGYLSDSFIRTMCDALGSQTMRKGADLAVWAFVPKLEVLKVSMFVHADSMSVDGIVGSVLQSRVHSFVSAVQQPVFKMATISLSDTKGAGTTTWETTDSAVVLKSFSASRSPVLAPRRIRYKGSNHSLDSAKDLCTRDEPEL